MPEVRHVSKTDSDRLRKNQRRVSGSLNGRRYVHPGLYP